MKREWLLLGLALTLGGLFGATPAAAEKWALMVGVNDYPFLDERFQLRGCENDVRLMAKLLTTKFGFKESNVRMLLSRQATRDSIGKAFRESLIDKARAGDMVFFQFSGHGSQVEDKNGDEEDGLDETLCASDVGPDTPDREITDDEIATWIEALHKKGVRDIVFVFDSCHSGTATKNVLLDTGITRPRYIEPFDLLGRPLEAKEVPLGAAERATEQDAPSDVILISGCKAAQQSNDAQFGGTYNGALTYFLHAALQNASPSMTYDDLMRDVRRRVQERFPTQTPQFEGPADRAVFAGRGEVPAKPFVVVTQADAKGVQIAAGVSSGVTAGSIYAVYKADDNALTGEGIGQIEITGVDASAARARVLRGGGAIKAGCRAVEESHFYPPDKLYVRVDAAQGVSVKEFVEAVGAIDYVGLVKQERSPDRIIKVTAAGGRMGAQIVTPDGLPGRTFQGADGIDLASEVRPELENAYTIKLLAQLENPNPSFRVRLSIDRETNPVYYFNRDKISFRVQADRDCYITVLDVGTSGKITVLFPNKLHPDNAVKGNQVYHLPLVDKPTFQIAVAPPVGREMVKVIATEKPVNLTGMDFQGMQSAFAGLPDSLNYAKKLATRVRDFIVVARPQPGGSTATPTAGWSTDFVTFQIRDPKEMPAR